MNKIYESTLQVTFKITNSKTFINTYIIISHNYIFSIVYTSYYLDLLCMIKMCPFLMLSVGVHFTSKILVCFL